MSNTERAEFNQEEHDRWHEHHMSLFTQAYENNDEAEMESQFEAMVKYWDKCEEHVEANAAPAEELIDIAHACIDAGDWANGEAAFREALSLPDLSDCRYVFLHRELIAICRVLQRDAEALALAEAAAAIARGSDSELLQAMCLVTESNLQLEANKPEAALPLVNESLAMFDLCEVPQLVSRARALLTRAECHVKLDNAEPAREDMETAAALLEPFGEAECLAGVQGTIAELWELKACFAEHEQDLKKAAECRRKSVRIWRHICSLWQCDEWHTRAYFAMALYDYARSLKALNRRLRAVFARCEADRIMTRLELPKRRPR